MPGININVSDKAVALQGVVQQVGQAIQGQALRNVIPQVRTGQLTPGAALDQIVQIGQSAVRSAPTPAGTTPREAVAAAQSAAREQVDQARTALQQVASQQTIETVLDPVGQVVTGTAREAGRAAGQSVERAVDRATAVVVKTGIGAGIGAAVAAVFDKSPSTGAGIGALAGLIFGFATGRRG